MAITTRVVSTATILELTGNLTMGKAVEELAARIRETLAGGAQRLGLNLTGVNYIDSSGLGALVGGFATVNQAGAKCVFFGASPAVTSILKLARLDTVFILLPDESSALSALAAAKPPDATP